MALAKQRQHLCGSHFRDAIYKVVLARGLIGPSEQSGRASHVSPGQRETGKKDLTDNETVNHASIILPREVESLLPVLLGLIQFVPFIEDTSQANMRFVDNLIRLLARQLQDAPVGLGCQRELIVSFLYLAQAAG